MSKQLDCRICGLSKMKESTLCERCFMIRQIVREQPDIVRKILDDTQPKQEVDPDAL